MKRLLVLLTGLAFTLSACAPGIPRDALKLSPESLADRQMQTRRFETANNETMLSAAAAIFQDLGFTLDESEFTLGIIVGSKQRDATNGAQVAGAILLAALTRTVVQVDSNQVIRASIVMREVESPDKKEAARQKLTPETVQRVKKDVTSLVATGLRKHFPGEVSERLAITIGENTAKTLATDLAKVMNTEASGESTVRVTFQRIIYNTAGQVTLQQQINEPQLYQEFFDKLSQAVFLEAHEL